MCIQKIQNTTKSHYFTEKVGKLLVFLINFKMDPTNDTAEEAQAGGITLPGIPRTLPP